MTTQHLPRSEGRAAIADADRGTTTVDSVAVPRRLMIAVAALVAGISLYDVQSHAPANIVELPGQHSIGPTLRAALPQGWAFFTKSPRDADVTPYSIDADGTLESDRLGPYANWWNAFGLDRAARSQGTELALLVSELDQADWTECGGDVEVCVDERSGGEMAHVVNVSAARTVCGPTVFAQDEPVTWAYRRFGKAAVRTTSIAMADVRC